MRWAKSAVATAGAKAFFPLTSPTLRFTSATSLTVRRIAVLVNVAVTNAVGSHRPSLRTCVEELVSVIHMRWVANIPIADAGMDRVPCQGLIDAGVATIGESLGSGINGHSSHDGRRYCGSSTHIR